MVINVGLASVSSHIFVIVFSFFYLNNSGLKDMAKLSYLEIL